MLYDMETKKINELQPNRKAWIQMVSHGRMLLANGIQHSLCEGPLILREMRKKSSELEMPMDGEKEGGRDVFQI